MTDEIYNSLCLTGTAATITDLLGAQRPEFAAEPLTQVLSLAERSFGRARADRVFMFNPDAIALWLVQKYTERFSPLFSNTRLWLPLLSIEPSVTPVCFASMYTGALPEIHGIKAYKKPVLTTDTVFDALIRSGKKPVIISTEGDSISKIFLERNMDYFIYPSEEECVQKALSLIEEDGYDMYVLYNGNYDSEMHHFSPEGRQALDALDDNIRTFSLIAEKIRGCWKSHDTLLAFAPDHGCHEIDGGLGSHGLMMPEDMNIAHFYETIKGDSNGRD